MVAILGYVHRDIALQKLVRLSGTAEYYMAKLWQNRPDFALYTADTLRKNYALRIAECEKLRIERDWIRTYAKLLQLKMYADALLEKAYNPDEPRDDHGRWTSEGGDEGTSMVDAGNVGSDAVIDDNKPQPAKDLSISQSGIDFIAAHENFRSQVYLDDAGLKTIGYGHLLLPGESYPDGITKGEGQQLLTNDLATAENAVRSYVKAPLTQSQFDMLASFTFNEGAVALKNSTLLQLLNQGDYNGAADQLPLWNKVHDGPLLAVDQGLVNRRADERNIFLNGY